MTRLALIPRPPSTYAHPRALDIAAPVPSCPLALVLLLVVVLATLAVAFRNWGHR